MIIYKVFEGTYGRDEQEKYYISKSHAEADLKSRIEEYTDKYGKNLKIKYGKNLEMLPVEMIEIKTED
jgi:uncharacterized FlaG/YvyC family protein